MDILNERYCIESVLGHSKTADVYFGRDYRLNRNVAIKVLRASLARDPRFLEHFMRQARLVASLSHPNIVSIYATETHAVDDGPDKVKVPFIVMEYVAGKTLQKHICRRNILIDQSIAYALEILSALECGHREGIVHRGVKPTNIIIDEVKNTLKVTDFGITEISPYLNLTNPEKALPGYGTTMPPTQALAAAEQYQALEAAFYISPEQARGEPADARSDLYSVAVMLYQMLTGKMPFTGASAVEVAFLHASGTPASPHNINPDVPAALNAVVMKALNKDPRDRFEAAADFAHALNIAKKEKVGYQSAYSRASWKYGPGAAGSSTKERADSVDIINNVFAVSKSKRRLFRFLPAGLLIIIAIIVVTGLFF